MLMKYYKTSVNYQIYSLFMLNTNLLLCLKGKWTYRLWVI